jgi:NitT/TauT family transport system permease protein
MGLGAGPMVVIAGVMVLVPVTINTALALRSVNPVLLKLGTSLACSRRHVIVKILAPAATPLAFPGIRLGLIYGVIATVAMELMLADEGLGFRVGDYYHRFQFPQMWGAIVAVSLLAMIITSSVSAIEHRLRKDML